MIGDQNTEEHRKDLVDWITVIAGDYGTNRLMSEWLVCPTIDAAVGNTAIADTSEENLLFDHCNVRRFSVWVVDTVDPFSFGSPKHSG